MAGIRPIGLGRRAVRDERWNGSLSRRQAVQFLVDAGISPLLVCLRREIVARTPPNVAPRMYGLQHDSYTESAVTWSDPASKFTVAATVKAFKKYPAVDWVLSFENKGESDSPIIENIQALDVRLRTGNSRNAAFIHHNQGDVCNERSFMPLDTRLESGKSFRIAPEGGRSSNGAFPSSTCNTAPATCLSQWDGADNGRRPLTGSPTALRGFAPEWNSPISPSIPASAFVRRAFWFYPQRAIPSARTTSSAASCFSNTSPSATATRFNCRSSHNASTVTRGPYLTGHRGRPDFRR